MAFFHLFPSSSRLSRWIPDSARDNPMCQESNLQPSAQCGRFKTAWAFWAQRLLQYASALKKLLFWLRPASYFLPILSTNARDQFPVEFITSDFNSFFFLIELSTNMGSLNAGNLSIRFLTALHFSADAYCVVQPSISFFYTTCVAYICCFDCSSQGSSEDRRPPRRLGARNPGLRA